MSKSEVLSKLISRFDPLDDPGSMRIALDYLRAGGFDLAADWFSDQLDRALRARSRGAVFGYFAFNPEWSAELAIHATVELARVIREEQSVPDNQTRSFTTCDDLRASIDDLIVIDDPLARLNQPLLGGLADRMRAQVEARRPSLDVRQARRDKSRTRDRRRK
jgi:hypothetical protein